MYCGKNVKPVKIVISNDVGLNFVKKIFVVVGFFEKKNLAW